MSNADYAPLYWADKDGYQEAILGTWPSDGVLFTLAYQPTCYRRGVWKLLIEVCQGEHHVAWGCFDDQDQPMRHYHSKGNAFSEAELIASVLWKGHHETK